MAQAAVLTKAAFAAELKISKARVSQYVKRGLPVRPDGKLDRLAAVNWVKGSRVQPSAKSVGLNSAAALAGVGIGNGGTTLDEERTRKIKLENDERERRLIRVEDAVAAVDAIVGPIPSDLAVVASRVTDDLALRRKIEDEINGVCRAISHRLRKASADLREGRDALDADAADDGVGMGEEE